MRALSQMDAVARFPGTKALPSLNREDRLASSPLSALPKRDRRNSGQPGRGGLRRNASCPSKEKPVTVTPPSVIGPSRPLTASLIPAFGTAAAVFGRLARRRREFGAGR